MKNLKYGIGIDISSEKFAVCISVIDCEQRVGIIARQSFSNNVEGFAGLMKWTEKHCSEQLPTVYVMEATGIYYEQLAWALYQKNNTVAIVLPNKAKKYKEALGLKSKTDPIDARALAQMACEQHLRVWKPASKNIYQLRLLTRQVDRINVHITQFKAQLHAISRGMYRDKVIEKMLAKNIQLLQSQKELIEERLKSIIKSDTLLAQRFDQICKIKGMGTAALAVVIAETDGFALMENQAQLVSYAGYDVVESQSGKRQGKTKISKQGNSRIRKALHLPALNLVRYKQAPFIQLYDRIYQRSGIKMKGYTAIQKKLLILIYTLWKKGQGYDPGYHIKSSNDVERAPSFV